MLRKQILIALDTARERQDSSSRSREYALVITKLEEAEMWLQRAESKDPVARNLNGNIQESITTRAK